MIKSRKLKLVMVLLLACICAPLSGAEANEAKTEMKFEINEEKSQPWISGTRRRAKGPIKPTHVAVFYIRPSNLPEGHEDILQILNTSGGKTLSENQRHFLTASDAVICLPFQDIRNHDQIRLYAVSEEEAKKTARAYLECAINRANAKVQEYEKYLNENKEKIIQIKKSLPEKQKQLKAAELKYKEVKDARYFLFDHKPAYEKARETMLQMDKMLDTLEIELAGILEKLKSIEKYRQRKYAEDGKNFSRETLDKLDQMFVEQMIELSSAKARQNAVLQIRNREKDFLILFDQWINLDSEVGPLQHDLETYENNLRDVEKILANPIPEMLPPKVFQNKVTIYPVRVED